MPDSAASSSPARKDEAHGFFHILRWKLGLGPSEPPGFSGAPDTPAIRIEPDLDLISHPGPLQATWIGHASWLIQVGGFSILIDPIFSSHCSPVPLLSFRRFQAPGLDIDQLPALDAVLLTHSHYDHLDLPSLRKLPGDPPLVIAAGHADWLQKKGFRNASECAWRDHIEIIDGLRVHAVPARHFTARNPFDRNRGHWCGWIIEAAGSCVYHAGDTAYDSAFQEIGKRFSPIDLAIIPVGAYAPRWVMESVHVTPPEAVAIHREVGARQSLASHWGTFRLTDEPLGEPPLWLRQECKTAGIDPGRFKAINIGETFVQPNSMESASTPNPTSPHPDSSS